MHTFTDLIDALNANIRGMSPDDCKALAEVSGTRLNLIVRRIRRYNDAQANAPRFGLIGVGAISFAENRVATFNRRARRVIDASHG